MSHARVSALFALTLVGSPGAAPGQGVQIAHDAVGCVVAGQFPRLEARIEPADGVGRARVYFRAEGSDAWYFVEMKAQAGGWTGLLPKPTAALRRFSYYLEVTGTAFEASRTREYAPRVVGARGECEARALVAAVSAVGPAFVGGPLGAPAVPAGFAGLSPTAPAAAGATGTAAASGGGSTGLVLGVVGGAAALAGGVVLAAGGSGSRGGSAAGAGSSGSGASASPSGGSGTRVPQNLILALSNNCTLTGGAAIYSGDTVRIARGVCAWSSLTEAQAACAGQSASLTVDGAPLSPVLYFIGYDGGGGLFCSSAEADWKAAAGRHVAAGVWTLPGSPLHSCSVDVLP